MNKTSKNSLPTTPEGLALRFGAHGLELTDGTIAICGDFARMASRVKPNNVQRELIVKAAKVKRVDGERNCRPTAIDATAGLGEDSFLLAAAGFDVRLYERNPVIAALLRDALERALDTPELIDIATHMQLIEGESVEALPHLDKAPDVVLLDPMFPSRRKNAAVKKKLQLLQQLESPCEDEEALLEAAFTAHPRKIVVKRPAKGPYLAGRKPDYSLSGKAVRFDCFTVV